MSEKSSKRTQKTKASFPHSSSVKRRNEVQPRDHVQSPNWAWHIAGQLAHIDPSRFYDPCPYQHHKLKPCVDGLKHSWKPWNYCNPPYSQLDVWVRRALQQWRDHGCQTVLFVPHRAHSHWFHDEIIGRFEVVPVRSEVQFQGFNNTLPLGMCFILIGPYDRTNCRTVNNPLYVLKRYLPGNTRATWKRVDEAQVPAELVNR